MNEDLKHFSIYDIQEVETDNSQEFFYARICVLSTRPNSHKVLITKEILERDGQSILGKWIVADTTNYGYENNMSHSINETIVGIIPKDSKIEYVTDEEGFTSMYVEGILSKLYGKKVFDMFKNNNKHNVSVEMQTADLSKDEYGNIPIEALNICAVTILGNFVEGSCPNANMSVVKFSADEANKFYEDYNKNSLKKFAEERKEKLNLVSHLMNKKEYSTADWDGDKAKHDAIKEEKFDTMAKSIFLKLDADYKERKIGSLHYPVMGLYGGVWKYNKEGLSSARAYGEQHDTTVADKAISIQKKLGLYNKEEKMEEKEFAIDIDVMPSIIWNVLMDRYPDENSEFNTRSSMYYLVGIYEENSQKFIIIRKKDELKQYRLSLDVVNNELILSEEMIEVETTFKEKDGISKLFEDNADDKNKPSQKQEDIVRTEEEKRQEKEMDCNPKMSEGKEKNFSLDAYVDSGAMLEMLKNETEENKKLVQKVVKMSAIEIVEKILELKKFQDDRLEKDKEAKLNQIMSQVKGDIDTKTFEALQQEGNGLSINELGGFENKVKAFAYEATKGKANVQEEDVLQFACNVNNYKENVNEDVFDKISKK